MLRILVLVAALMPHHLQAGVKNELIGGHPTRDYPAVVYVNNFFSACTATIVGPRVLLIAAHCMANNSNVQSDRPGAPQFKARCYHAPKIDIALCLIDKEIPKPYAHISKVGPKVDDEVLLMGYGCIQRGGGGGNDGILRAGKAKVVEIEDDELRFITKSDVALCSGDSGGPTLIEGAKHPRVIGVNSRGDLHQISILVSTFSQQAKDFMAAFASLNHVVICGVNSQC